MGSWFLFLHSCWCNYGRIDKGTRPVPKFDPTQPKPFYEKNGSIISRKIKRVKNDSFCFSYRGIRNWKQTNIIFIIEAVSLPKEIFKKRFKREKKSESSIWEVQSSLFSRYFHPPFYPHFNHNLPRHPWGWTNPGYNTEFRHHHTIRSLFPRMRQSNWVNRFQWKWENVILCRTWTLAKPRTINQKWNHLKHSTQKRILDTVFFKTKKCYFKGGGSAWQITTCWPASLE